MSLSTGRIGAVVGVAGVAVGALLAGSQGALAGHANPVLATDLDGRQEVATGATNRRIVGDPNATGEAYVFGVDGDPARAKLCYVLLADKLAGTESAPGAPRAAHIHRGAAGTNGPVVVNLAWPQGGQAADCFSLGDTRGGNPVFVNGGTPAEIFDNPGGFYVNVHNADYPAGAIRGQLAAR